MLNSLLQATKNKFPLKDKTIRAQDTSTLTSGNVSANPLWNVAGTSGTGSPGIFEYTTDSYIKKSGAVSGHSRITGYTSVTNSVTASMSLKRNSGVGNAFLMLYGNTIPASIPADYYVVGHHGTNGICIYRSASSVLTLVASVAYSFTSGEKVIKAVANLCPSITGSNPAKISIGVYVDDVLVLQYSAESVPAGCGKQHGIWMDNTGTEDAILIKNFTVYEQNPRKIVYFGDSITAGSSGLSSSALRYSTLSCTALNYTEQNMAVGGATVYEARFSQLPTWLATSPVVGTNNTAIIMLGTNDLDRGLSPQSVLTSVRDFCIDLRNTGLFRSIGVHTLPAMGVIGNMQNMYREAYNLQLAKSYKEFCDGIGCAGTDAQIGIRQAAYTLVANTATTGFFTDRLHPNNLGHRILSIHDMDLIMSLSGV